MPDQPVEKFVLSRVTQWRLAAGGVVAALLGLALLWRLVSLQVVHRDEYVGQVREQSRRLVVIPAARGDIYDRHGRLLVGNRPMFSIMVNVAELRSEFTKEYVRLLQSDAVLRDLADPKESGEKNNAKKKKKGHDPEAERRQRERGKRRAELRVIAHANVLEPHLERLNALFQRTEKISLDLKKVAERLASKSSRRAVPFTLVSDISEQEYARFIEHEPPSSPLSVFSEPVRKYPDAYRESAAHVLGYVTSDRQTTERPDIALPDSDDAESALAKFLALDKKVRRRNTQKLADGQRAVSGIEARFDTTLRGEPGYEIVTVSPSGYAFEREEASSPRKGTDLTLSLDIEFQRSVENALRRRFPENRACVVALNAQTGEVLVCANSPSFDPSRRSSPTYNREYLDKYDLLFNPSAFVRDAAGKPQRDVVGELIRRPDAAIGEGAWLNHATQGRYPPGSSFKPVTAFASLRSGLISPARTYYCNSFIEIGEGKRRKKFVEHDGRAFGEVNITRMLQVSSNVFCYQAGLEIGIEHIAEEAKRFGFGEKTTIEIASYGGQVPSPAWMRKEMGVGWSQGDTANTSVGQGNLLTTPIQLAAFAASIARRETRTDVTIINSPERREGHRHGGEPIGLSAEQEQAVIDGLVACAHEPSGTGRRVTADLPLPEGWRVAAKTGTAQVKNNTANLAWTIGFAPVHAPEIAFAVLVESKDNDTRFAGGANAGPIANHLLREWLKIRAGEKQSQ